MSLFNEQQKQQAMAAAIKEKLRAGGMAGIAFKLYCKTGDNFDIVFEGVSESDVAKAERILGVKAKSLSKPDVSRIDPELRAEIQGGINTKPTVSTRPNSKRSAR